MSCSTDGVIFFARTTRPPPAPESVFPGLSRKSARALADAAGSETVFPGLEELLVLHCIAPNDRNARTRRERFNASGRGGRLINMLFTTFFLFFISPPPPSYLSPTLIPLQHPMAACRGPTNLVLVKTKNMGENVFQGPGAGRYPTANSVVNDIAATIQHYQWKIKTREKLGVFEEPRSRSQSPKPKARKIELMSPGEGKTKKQLVKELVDKQDFACKSW